MPLYLCEVCVITLHILQEKKLCLRLVMHPRLHGLKNVEQSFYNSSMHALNHDALLSTELDRMYFQQLSH